MIEIVEKKFLITSDLIKTFAEISTDHNPIHLDEEYAASTVFKRRIAHGMCCASFFSAIIANELPGPGSIYLGQSLKFLSPVYIDDVLRVEVRILNVRKDKPIYTLSTKAFVGDNLVIDGEAVVLK
jgi:3-hydroxybutyryl-CoA dehydratase